MRGDAPDRFPEIVIHVVDAVLVLRRLGDDDALPDQQRPELLSQGRVVADGLGDDIPGSGQRRVPVGDIAAQEFRGLFPRIAVFWLRHQPCRQRLQPALPGDRGARASLGAEGAIDVLELRQ